MIGPVALNHPTSCFLFHLRLWAVCVLLFAPALVWAGEEPFEANRLEVPGRPVQVWTGAFSAGCPNRTQDLLVISVDGTPPRERRRVLLFPCTANPRGDSSGVREFAVGSDVVAVDTDPHGHQLLLLSAKGLELISLADPEIRREIRIPDGLPLIPRSRGLSRIPMVGPWGPNGKPAVLLPTLKGALVVDLLDEDRHALAFPMIADYATQAPGLPDPTDPFLSASFSWPLLLAGHDTADGKLDLFALTRWTMTVFRAGEAGLPGSPSRQIEIRPFEDSNEIRPEQINASYRIVDLDSNGLSDLVLHRSWGSLMQGRAVTSLYLNRGDGPRPDGPPDAQRALDDGFSSIEFLDLDGDGWLEGVETSMQFGLVQVVRMLLTRSGKATLRILSVGQTEPHSITSTWEGDLHFKIDFAQARIEGLYPILDTDWNADGRKDMLFVESKGKIAIRLGRAGASGPSFGKTAARQAVDLRAGRTSVADLDGDGLEDLIVYDPQTSDGDLWLYYNRGTLPGTPADLEAGSRKK